MEYCIRLISSLGVIAVDGLDGKVDGRISYIDNIVINNGPIDGGVVTRYTDTERRSDVGRRSRSLPASLKSVPIGTGELETSNRSIEEYTDNELSVGGFHSPLELDHEDLDTSHLTIIEGPDVLDLGK